MPSFDFVLVKQKIELISAENNSVGGAFALIFAVMAALMGFVRGRKEETAAFAAVAA